MLNVYKYDILHMCSELSTTVLWLLKLIERLGTNGMTRSEKNLTKVFVIIPRRVLLLWYTTTALWSQ